MRFANVFVAVFVAVVTVGGVVEATDRFVVFVRRIVLLCSFTVARTIQGKRGLSADCQRQHAVQYLSPG